MLHRPQRHMTFAVEPSGFSYRISSSISFNRLSIIHDAYVCAFNRGQSFICDKANGFWRCGTSFQRRRQRQCFGKTSDLANQRPGLRRFAAIVQRIDDVDDVNLLFIFCVDQCVCWFFSAGADFLPALGSMSRYRDDVMMLLVLRFGFGFAQSSCSCGSSGCRHGLIDGFRRFVAVGHRPPFAGGRGWRKRRLEMTGWFDLDHREPMRTDPFGCGTKPFHTRFKAVVAGNGRKMTCGRMGSASGRGLG